MSEPTNGDTTAANEVTTPEIQTGEAKAAKKKKAQDGAEAASPSAAAPPPDDQQASDGPWVYIGASDIRKQLKHKTAYLTRPEGVDEALFVALDQFPEWQKSQKA